MNPDLILSHYDNASLWPNATEGARWPDIAAAYRSALALRALRLARGEQAVGYKIGYTNQSAWERNGVSAPIWGSIWDTTLLNCDEHCVVDLTGTSMPRLEPEITFGISATPPAGATLEDIFACVEWLAPSFELVQSHKADWKPAATEAIADGGLHARQIVGRRTPVRSLANSGAALNGILAAAQVHLYRDQALIDEGAGAIVLGGPLQSILHFVGELRACPGAPDLKAGDIVTTGTWTNAWPLEPGQAWRAEFGAPLAPLEMALR
ncbi:hydratase [Candidimonas sp. SYP-B2681]|uniref:2-keto-4-pentenoate hydratase n=1 Tax=Candidimonas sp. SYP-B2681 TaxID=2497686 RepID=UPI000F87D233|nr:hydratase [Candidimonas sp. SYP-B2681]RTZ44623.1 hydratase [Candidimonas sp. SYP-B2681]